jgi:hypothetical protein
VNRSDLQWLARSRLREARILLREGQHSGAYYLAGYAVECGLKAVIASQFQRYEFPDKNLVNKSHTHNLEVLLGLAGLDKAFGTDSAADPDLDVAWAVAKDWSEAWRYQRATSTQARDLVNAVGGPQHGVLPWITRQW